MMLRGCLRTSIGGGRDWLGLNCIGVLIGVGGWQRFGFIIRG